MALQTRDPNANLQNFDNFPQKPHLSSGFVQVVQEGDRAVVEITHDTSNIDQRDAMSI